MPRNKSWEEWFNETIFALKDAIVTANVEWATAADGTPWVVLGQRRPKGIGYPHSMIMRYTVQLDTGASMRSNHLFTIQTEIVTFRLDDAAEPELNLLNATANMAAIMDELYADRSLGGTCEKLTITQTDSFQMESTNGHESAGHIQVEIDKHAEV